MTDRNPAEILQLARFVREHATADQEAGVFAGTVTAMGAQRAFVALGTVDCHPVQLLSIACLILDRAGERFAAMSPPALEFITAIELAKAPLRAIADPQRADA